MTLQIEGKAVIEANTTYRTARFNATSLFSVWQVPKGSLYISNNT